jgi:hypothetical protein
LPGTSKRDRDEAPADPWQPCRDPRLSRELPDRRFYGLNPTMARFDDTRLRILIDS